MRAIETVTGGTLTIEGTELHVVELEDVAPDTKTLDCQLPDERWSYTDAHGHLHRWWLRADQPKGRKEREPQAPTLVKTYEHVECDGTCGNWDCEGYSIPVWHCVACGEQVEPKFRPGTTTIETSSGYWLVTVEGEPFGPGEGPAVLLYPSGPGQMMRMTGQARQLSHVRHCESGIDDRRRDVREFQFMPDRGKG